MQSQDDRDREGLAARRERDGVVKEFPDEEFTGRYEGEELEQRRATRPPDERFGRLEKKHDELKKDVEKKHDELKRDFEKKHDELKTDVNDARSEVKVLSAQVADVRTDVAGANGKLDGQEKVLTEMLSIVKKTAIREADREHVTFTAMVDVDRAKELAKVEVDKEQQLEPFDKRRTRRRSVLRILSLLASGGGIIELLHRIGVL